jgi:hypothetical protein
MTVLLRFVAAAAMLLLATGCNSTAVIDAYSADVPAVHGHVYLIRGLMGEVFSRGLDNLADKISQHGVAATVRSSYRVGALANEIIENYRREPGPIILIGHSTGGDAAITIAQQLREAKIPVGIIFGFDPTPIAGRVPDNVELFINLFQKTNPIGGGVAKADEGFRGRLINVDLREHSEIIHVTLDKSSRIHNVVVDEIMGFMHAKQLRDGSVTAQAGYGGQGQPPSVNFIRPYFLAYVVPPNEPIEIWDSGIQVATRPGESLQEVAANYGVPPWLLAQVNKLDAHDALTGRALIVPQHMYRRQHPAFESAAPR